MSDPDFDTDLPVDVDPQAQLAAEQKRNLVINAMYNLTDAAKALEARGWTVSQELDMLIEIAQDQMQEAGERRQAAKEARSIIKSIMEVTGVIGTAEQRRQLKGASGETVTQVLTGQTILTRLQQKDLPDGRNSPGTRVLPPVSPDLSGQSDREPEEGSTD